MFDIGFSEMLVLGLIALVVIGPKQLPGLARALGFWVGHGRRMLNEVKSDIKKEMNEQNMRNLLDAKKEFDNATKNLNMPNRDIMTDSGKQTSNSDISRSDRKNGTQPDAQLVSRSNLQTDTQSQYSVSSAEQTADPEGKKTKNKK